MAAAEKDKGEEERRGRGNRGRWESWRERAGRERARRKEREEAFTKERPGRKWLILGQVGGWHSRGRVWWEEADAWGGVRAGLGETDHARAWPGHAKGLGLDAQGNMEPLNLCAKNTEHIWDLGRHVCSVEWLIGGGGCGHDSAFWKQVGQETPGKNRSESRVTGWLRSKWQEVGSSEPAGWGAGLIRDEP